MEESEFQRLVALLAGRAKEADECPPLIYTSQDIVDNWVLVPRAHLRTIQSWNGEIDEAKAIQIVTAILADARLLGRREASDVDV